MASDMNLKDHIRSIPDFPKPGILFYDISTLLAHAKAWHETIERLAEMARRYKPDGIAGIESRGVLLAAPLALALGPGLITLRKKGKLPGTAVRPTYALEYGTDTIEIQQDAVKKGARVLLVDDLLATGGTLAAAVTLLEQVGAVVPAAACVIELTFLEGRKKLSVPVETLLKYDSLSAKEAEGNDGLDSRLFLGKLRRSAHQVLRRGGCSGRCAVLLFQSARQGT